ncbi:MAG: SDR family oxidoreductase [Salinibacterium sp.]|nr:SDR family oxidoreductase [Salinibacterium sp.]
MTDQRSIHTPLSGRRALVSGAGRGLGRAIATSLSEAGAVVVGVSRNAEQLADFVREAQDAGREAHAVSADLRSDEDVSRAAEKALALVGGIDILVNNAGINIKRPTVALPADGPVGQPGTGPASMPMSVEEWDSILETHVHGSLRLIREIVPGMLERRFGRVINIGSSTVGRLANMVAPYQVAKGALTHLTLALAKEWAPYGVTVNAISPGQFRTDMSKALHDSKEGQEFLKARIPMGHAGDARELGALAAHLASDLSSFITGQVIYVDGGETL